MEMSQLDWDSLDILNLPCFKVSGRVIRNGKPLSPTELKKQFGMPFRIAASALVNIPNIVRNDKRVRAEIRENPFIPETTFSFDPSPEAFTTTDGAGTIQINAGIYFALDGMPHTITWLDSLTHKDTLKIGELMDLEIPQEIMDEVDAIMKVWYSIHRTGWIDTSKLNLGEDLFLLQQMLTFVTFHEIGHWYQTVYLPGEWEKLIRITKNYLISWLKEDSHLDTDKAMRRQIRLLLKDPEVFEHWAHEIQADMMAFHACLNAFGGGWSPELKQTTYIAQATTLSVLQMQEVFYAYVLKQPLSALTHPPSYIRESIFCHIRAKEMKISIKDFHLKEWRIGFIHRLVMERILKLYGLSLKD